MVVNAGGDWEGPAISPKVRVVTLRQGNLSAARNAALHFASGEIVGFLDDDATPPPRWCGSLLAALWGLAHFLMSFGLVRAVIMRLGWRRRASRGSMGGISRGSGSQGVVLGSGRNWCGRWRVTTARSAGG